MAVAPARSCATCASGYPVALHGVSMSLGSADGLDGAYLQRLRALVDEIEPLFVSDHLSWSRIEGFNSHDLLPLPYTRGSAGRWSAPISIARRRTWAARC
jgi:uncharacterized protein (UPF0276 family)